MLVRHTRRQREDFFFVEMRSGYFVLSISGDDHPNVMILLPNRSYFSCGGELIFYTSMNHKRWLFVHETMDTRGVFGAQHQASPLQVLLICVQRRMEVLGPHATGSARFPCSLAVCTSVGGVGPDRRRSEVKRTHSPKPTARSAAAPCRDCFTVLPRRAGPREGSCSPLLSWAPWSLSSTASSRAPRAGPGP
jgi:hypothetical protein